MVTSQKQMETMATPAELDFSQIGETVRMLNLAIAHINWSLKEGDDSVETLGNSFTSMAGGITAIEDITGNLPDNVEAEIKQVMAEKCNHLSYKIQAAIMAFQFYDRITQQLTHVCNSLSSLGELLSDKEKLFQPYEWHALQNQIRSRYTMESEKEMFDALMRGETIENVLRAAQEHSTDAKDGDDVELF